MNILLENLSTLTLSTQYRNKNWFQINIWTKWGCFFLRDCFSFCDQGIVREMTGDVRLEWVGANIFSQIFLWFGGWAKLQNQLSPPGNFLIPFTTWKLGRGYIGSFEFQVMLKYYINLYLGIPNLSISINYSLIFLVGAFWGHGLLTGHSHKCQFKKQGESHFFQFFFILKHIIGKMLDSCTTIIHSNVS